jgi:hypothetical protein
VVADHVDSGAASHPTPQPWDAPRDSLSVAEHADTLVMSGNARALHEAGDELTSCGNEVAGNDEIHRYGGPALLSQFNGPDRRPAGWHLGMHDPRRGTHLPPARWARIKSEPSGVAR